MYAGFQEWISGQGKDSYSIVKKDEVDECLAEAQDIVLQSVRQNNSKAD